ncbi:hypothetical protein BS47DRAFT_1368125 [Hydnum rufescens UP504]|uniref:Uncharacterized protein n=1 Tax=Hydnum rufescens UP504 TaxID=1448309 RepID=A0A9P6DP69_9AGAM|nr:hypothetical protein BS47DRAFT_1368125 [Hydnum rufescens UP504]
MAGHLPKHSSQPLPLISPTDFTIVPHMFNQFQLCDSVYDRVNGVRCLSYPYYNKCQKFFQTSEALYKGWLEVAWDWLGNESQWLKAPVMPATSSLCNELEDIQHQNKDVLHVNGLIITAYEFNGYASYLMFCCIDKLVETFKANTPVFCIDDRIIGAVFGNSVGNKETVWSHLDDLVNTLHESGSLPPAFLKPLNPPNPEVNPSNPEVKLRIWDGFDEDEGEDGDDDYDTMSLVNNMLQQGVLEADDDFQACVDRENSRKVEQAKEEEEG